MSSPKRKGKSYTKSKFLGSRVWGRQEFQTPQQKEEIEQDLEEALITADWACLRRYWYYAVYGDYQEGIQKIWDRLPELTPSNYCEFRKMINTQTKRDFLMIALAGKKWLPLQLMDSLGAPKLTQLLLGSKGIKSPDTNYDKDQLDFSYFLMSYSDSELAQIPSLVSAILQVPNRLLRADVTHQFLKELCLKGAPTYLQMVFPRLMEKLGTTSQGTLCRLAMMHQVWNRFPELIMETNKVGLSQFSRCFPTPPTRYQGPQLMTTPQREYPFSHENTFYQYLRFLQSQIPDLPAYLQKWKDEVSWSIIGHRAKFRFQSFILLAVQEQNYALVESLRMFLKMSLRSLAKLINSSQILHPNTIEDFNENYLFESYLPVIKIDL